MVKGPGDPEGGQPHWCQLSLNRQSTLPTTLIPETRIRPVGNIGESLIEGPISTDMSASIYRSALGNAFRSVT
jgi:hypothetical protein